MSEQYIPRKQEKDFTPEVDAAIPASEALATGGNVSEAIDKLLVLEKQTRNASDLASTSRILKAVVSILYKSKKYTLLNTQIVALSKKHGQLRQAVQDMVDVVMGYLEELTGEDKLSLIETVRDVTEGKIFLELPRARATRILATIKEGQGDNKEASELLQELQIETFGSMELREKIDFILEQLRYLTLIEDWEKFAIVCKKINIRWLNEEGHQDLKARYYKLMILHGLATFSHLQVCQYYLHLYELDDVREDASKYTGVLRNAVLFVILSPHDHEQSDALHRIATDEKLATLPELVDLITLFTTSELIRWPGLQSTFGAALRKTNVFRSTGTSGSGVDAYDIDITLEKADAGETRWKTLQDRIAEHNIRVVAEYYTRISLSRLSELLDLDIQTTEDFVSRLVINKTVYAKIDRPAGLVVFRKPQSGRDVLNSWNADVAKVMSLVDKSCHLIAKEYAVHAALRTK